ncbi:MAG TPA: hypothetical protein VGC67_04920 [Cellulomonas sp.]
MVDQERPEESVRRRSRLAQDCLLLVPHQRSPQTDRAEEAEDAEDAEDDEDDDEETPPSS